MITWSQEYEIGIPVIDRQHQRIIEYINQVELLKEAAGDREKTAEILTLLVDYTLSHFEFEEALMEQARYASLEEHQVTHKAFIDQIENLHTRFKNGEDIANTLAQVLMNWLLDHIKEDDSSYAACVKENILGQAPENHRNWVQQATKRYFRH
ncbi:hemerythrin [Alteromonadaceae bacterium 2753L.S.0a.02]|nr:hemerythrin [Alteromonadaceae bacterium 2753L.S.0a.02]